MKGIKVNMADEQFTSKRVVDVKAGFDASKLKGKSVLVTGGQRNV